ncbi:MAG: hypothetical protein ACK5LC_00405 [Coprobacillaceae bacterium]
MKHLAIYQKIYRRNRTFNFIILVCLSLSIILGVQILHSWSASTNYAELYKQTGVITGQQTTTTFMIMALLLLLLVIGVIGLTILIVRIFAYVGNRNFKNQIQQLPEEEIHLINYEIGDFRKDQSMFYSSKYIFRLYGLYMMMIKKEDIQTIDRSTYTKRGIPYASYQIDMQTGEQYKFALFTGEESKELLELAKMKEKKG